mmetsp:Transcript_576/g.857  ORF Transcript_576/g.857 Transcript_576/m.857 type:complete len:241 (-) Transcript_576:82-804(-)
MIRRQEDPPKQLLLEPFPSRVTSVLKIPENWHTFSGSLRNLKTTFTNDSQEESTTATAATATESFLSCTEGGVCFSDMYMSSSSVDAVTGETLMQHEMYPLHVASVINDDIAFRQLQSDLRNSGMVTSYGARYIMKPMIEKRAEEVVERQRQEFRIFQAQQEEQRRLREGGQQEHGMNTRRDIMKEKNNLISKSQRDRWLANAKSLTSLAFLQPRSDTNEDIIMAKLPPVRKRASIGRAA